jgi:hypothetical protein
VQTQWRYFPHPSTPGFNIVAILTGCIVFAVELLILTKYSSKTRRTKHPFVRRGILLKGTILLPMTFQYNETNVYNRPFGIL